MVRGLLLVLAVSARTLAAQGSDSLYPDTLPQMGSAMAGRLSHLFDGAEDPQLLTVILDTAVVLGSEWMRPNEASSIFCIGFLDSIGLHDPHPDVLAAVTAPPQVTLRPATQCADREPTISIAGLGYFYLGNRHTLSTIFERDLLAPRHKAERLRHMTALVLG